MSVELTGVAEPPMANGELVFEAEGNTKHMHRSLDELVRYLCADNDIPDGTVLNTGTAVGVPNTLAIEDGDVVEIEIEGLGTIRNRAHRFSSTWPGG